MLKVSAPFPHPGAHGFIAPLGDRVRIIQRNRDGTMLVHREDLPKWDRTASSTLTVQPAELFETATEAIERRPGATVARRRYRARRPAPAQPAFA